MTEIPEHLLKRSQARRAAAGGAEATSSETKPAETKAATPASAPSSGPVTRAAAPAPEQPPAPKPDSPVVAAAKSRKRIPAWAMMGLALLPVWGFMYVNAITPQAVEPTGPLAVGATTYAGVCASCHGAQGQGGVGRQFSNGEVLKTFPHIEDQLRYVYYGTDAYNAAAVEIPGDPNREGGAHITGAFGAPMPAQGGQIGDVEILGAVCHERYPVGGADPESEEYLDEYELWCSEESPVYALLEAGSSLKTIEVDLGPETPIIPIGEAPVAGSPAS